MNTTPIEHKIEFMVWNYNENKMHSHYEIDDMDKDSFDVWSDVIKGINGWTPMQLTALRSINNEPIYNHMIVKSEHSRIYCVDMFNYDLMYALKYCKLEIVGNRFQHSELLELCK